MKGLYKFLVLTLMIVTGGANAQIMITKPGDTVMHKSAMLEVKSNERGFLPPRMSTAERRAIQSPAAGLMVFDTTKQKMFLYTKAGWHSFDILPESFGVSDGSAFPNPGFSVNELVGHKVEIFGDYAYLGAVGSTISGKVNQGAVYMYKYENGTWNFISKIIAPDGQAGDLFCSDISATEDYVFISASGDSYGENTVQGSVYIYKWIEGILTYQSKITGSNATSGDRFGTDIEAKDKLLVVGAPSDDIGENSNQGSVYFFELEGENWVEKQKYFATANVGSNNLFGSGICIDSNFVVVGCDYLNTTGNYGFNRNRVSIFSRAGGTGEWLLHSEIVNPTGQNFEAFGYSLTLKSDILTISATMHDNPTGNKDRGVVYVYKRNEITWGLIQTIAPTDSSTGDLYGDYLGYHSDRDNNVLILTGHFEDFGVGQLDYGAAFMYEWNGLQFVQVKKMRSASPQVYEYFGSGAAIQNGRIVIGAMGRNSSTGAGYFFRLE